MRREFLLFTSEFTEARDEIEAIGGVVAHRLSERVFVAQVPESAEPTQLKRATIREPEDLAETDCIVARAWRNRGTKQDPEHAARDEGLVWDAAGHKPPGKI